MDKRIRSWQIAGFIFIGIAGTLLHFLYEWTKESILIAPFSAVNESIFEHIKLLYFPWLVFSLIEGRYLADKNENFWCAKLKGIIVGIILIPTIFYTYTGALGVMADWFNIAIFFIVSAVLLYTEAVILNSRKCLLPSAISLFIIILIGIILVVLTFFPFHIPLFKDPVTNLYGIA